MDVFFLGGIRGLRFVGCFRIFWFIGCIGKNFVLKDYNFVNEI